MFFYVISLGKQAICSKKVI
jgi:hypothetical protein